MPTSEELWERRMEPEVWFLLLKRRLDTIEIIERLGIGCWRARYVEEVWVSRVTIVDYLRTQV
jgi:hypothetical protein